MRAKFTRSASGKDKPLIRVNCASIPKELYESEFFGHVRGAFTGAIKDRIGRFEAAHGGTLFLDEIGEIPIDLQSKLLRALQEKQDQRVGDERTKRADVRIIAATNRDLKAEAAAGRFREDLYYRLNVFPVQAAPLRERREDIPLLYVYFVEMLVKELKCPKPRLTEAGVAGLQDYDWPGNIRELRNVIECAMIVAQGKALEFELPIFDGGRTCVCATHVRQSRDRATGVSHRAGNSAPRTREFARRPEQGRVEDQGSGWRGGAPGREANHLDIAD